MSSKSTSFYSPREEFLNAFTHGVGLVVAIFGLVYLIVRAEGSTPVTSVAIYGASLVFMFLSSTIYHGISHEPFKPALKLLDHSAIYLLIAGTYTPFLLVSLDGWIATAGIFAIWSIAFIGLVFKWFTGNRFPKASVIFYLLMGWLIVLFAYPLSQVIHSNGLWLILAGGLCFSIGVIFYVADNLSFNHAIWHCFVIAGCACHFSSIYYFVI